MNTIDANILAALAPAVIEKSDQTAIEDYKALVERALNRASEKRRLAAESWRLRDDLGPIAYDGDPASARVLLLKANPSYGEGATRATHFQPHADWPLSVAGPHIPVATRAYYHGRVFGKLVEAGVSLGQISKHLLKVELCPWASKKWPTGQRALLQQLNSFPSRQATYAMVGQLVEQGAIILIARAEEDWFAGVPALARLEGKRVFISRAKIAPAISDRMYPGSWGMLTAALRA